VAKEEKNAQKGTNPNPNPEKGKKKRKKNKKEAPVGHVIVKTWSSSTLFMEVWSKVPVEPKLKPARNKGGVTLWPCHLH